MKIAVFGYYHHLNYGDDRLGQALVHALYPHTVVLLPHNQPPPPLDWFDFVLIGGGGLVWERVGIWANVVTWLTQSKKPFGVVGLGINELNADLKPDLLWMVEHAQIFAVRDRKSHALLDFHPKAVVMPDLTWMIPYPLRDASQINESIALSVASKHPQGYDPMQWRDVLMALDQVVPFPLRFGNHHDSDIFQRLGFETVTEFSIEPLYRCRFLIATRFHSVVFALQIGVPFVAILYDDKVRRLLEDQGLADLGLEIDQMAQLPSKIATLTQNLESVLARIVEISDRSRVEGTQLKMQLINQVNAASPTKTVKQRVSYWLKHWLKHWLKQTLTTAG
jgi:polysaccharide pyruvyl transferase WcaK-like protein